MTVHHHSNGNILTAALKAIRWIREWTLLQWHAEYGHGNILSEDKKIFKIEQYNHQNMKIDSLMFREVKENVLRVQGGHHPSYVMVLWEVSYEMTCHFCKKGVKLISKCIKRTCYKEL
jgi:hypothetical protein